MMKKEKKAKYKQQEIFSNTIVPSNFHLIKNIDYLNENRVGII